jgi:hypothetical protein
METLTVTGNQAPSAFQHYRYTQCFGSGSDPDLIRSVDPDPEGQK